MDSEVEPSAKAYHAAYVASFNLWLQLRDHAREHPTLPYDALSIKDFIPEQPCLRPDLKLGYIKYARHSRAYVSGCSQWGSMSTANCQHEIPSFHLPIEVTVSATNVIAVDIQQSEVDNSYNPAWFAATDQNYFSILTLAWAYILSARWVELVPGDTSISYTTSQATKSQKSPNAVFIGNCSKEEIRWWSAVLAPDRGWQAMVKTQADQLLAPWSLSLSSSHDFQLSYHIDEPIESSSSSIPDQAMAFSDAIGFLDKFCRFHGIHDQSIAALAAVLLLPSVRGSKPISLPIPKMNQIEQAEPLKYISENVQPLCDTPCHDDLDRLLTLSCHVRGINSILLGAFFEPSVECNKSGPWLQGTLDATKDLIDNEPWLLARMVMERLPEAAFLWLGVSILGLQQVYLKQVGFGQIPVDLSAAAWSCTIQSFIQEPVSSQHRKTAHMSRADECRLLFISQVDRHHRPPFCQWAPFGSTPIEETDIEIRLHRDCVGHVLQYQRFIWDSETSNTLSQQLTRVARIPQGPRQPPLVTTRHTHPTLPSPEELDHTKEGFSEAVTRNMFSWLRPDGHAASEKQIWDHEWFDIGSSDDEEAIDDDDMNKTMSFSHVCSWVQHLTPSSPSFSEG